MTVRLLGFFLLLSIVAIAEEKKPSSEALNRELTAVRLELEQARSELLANNAALREKQHGIEYGVPEVVAVRETIVALERQLIEKRKELQVLLALQPEWKKLEEQRVQLFSDIKRLRATEVAIRNELHAQGQSVE